MKINILSSIAAVAILLAGLITYQFYLKSKDIRDPKLDDKRVLLVLPFQNLANSKKLLNVLEDLMGGPCILFKDKINFKRPGAGGFRPHQDVQACLLYTSDAADE